MTTQRFSWKDRDTVALDLIQLVYHAPTSISQRTLSLLSAIRSDAIIPDLKSIALDSQRPYWDQNYALRALGAVRSNVYFPELISVVEQDAIGRQRIIGQRGMDNETLTKLYFPNDRMVFIIGFVASHPANENWLFDAMNRLDPRVLYTLLIEQLMIDMPKRLLEQLVLRLLPLVENNPALLTLSEVSHLYNYYEDNPRVRALLQSQFDTIVQQAIEAKPPAGSRNELASSVPWRWSELKTAVFRLRPDYEEKFLRDEAQYKKFIDKWQANRTEDPSYKETAIWRELEALYERAQTNPRPIWELHRKTYVENLSIPTRAAATHLLGKLRDHPGVIDKLTYLARTAQDTWDDLSPVRFEAGKALFEAATPQAWEGLVEAYLAASTNLLMSSLEDWIAWLTDLLSGINEPFEETDYGVERAWRKALARESTE